MDDSVTMVGKRCSECGRKITSWTYVGGLMLCAICFSRVFGGLPGHEPERNINQHITHTTGYRGR